MNVIIDEIDLIMSMLSSYLFIIFILVTVTVGKRIDPDSVRFYFLHDLKIYAKLSKLDNSFKTFK